MQIEAFDAKKHNRRYFESGNQHLDTYLQRHLSQNVKKGIVQAYVSATDQGQILGYYTLSAASVSHNDMPDNIAKKLPRYPIPAILIGRMATSLQARADGLRIGSKLLIHALKQTLKAATTVGVVCIIVDAKPEAVGFYQRFGFLPLKQHDNLRLFLPVNTIKKMQES